MKAFLFHLSRRVQPLTLAVALVCGATAAAGVAWAQTRINPSSVSVSGNVIGDDVLYSIGGILSGRNPWRVLRYYLPAYLTAVGTMSSAATLPAS